MERLTKIMQCTNGNKLYDFSNKVISEYKEHSERVKMAVKKLAEYEDAEEQGLLLKLPCSENTTVYVIENNTDVCSECDYFVVGHCCEDYCNKSDCDAIMPQLSDEPACEKQYLEVIEMKPNLDWIFHNRNNFGKTVFLTKEEAEQTLKKMESEG